MFSEIYHLLELGDTVLIQKKFVVVHSICLI